MIAQQLTNAIGEQLALSVRQPWAWMIVNLGKDIENRSWLTGKRGRFLIHAARAMTRASYEQAKEFAISRLYAFEGKEVEIPDFNDLQRGGIIGEVELVDCVNHHPSPWFEGPLGLVLRNPKPLPFQYSRGSLGFFVSSVR